MTTPPVWDFNLTSDQAMKIAIISLNWAMVDMILGHALANVSGIQNPIDAADLIQALDLSKKVDLIAARKKRGVLHKFASPLVTEMNFVIRTYRPDRNMLAHGVAAMGADGAVVSLWSASKLKALSLTELDNVVSEAQYAAHLADHLQAAMLGLTHARPLPPRPPERPRPG